MQLVKPGVGRKAAKNLALPAQAVGCLRPVCQLEDGSHDAVRVGAETKHLGIVGGRQYLVDGPGRSARQVIGRRQGGEDLRDSTTTRCGSTKPSRGLAD